MSTARPLLPRAPRWFGAALVGATLGLAHNAVGKPGPTPIDPCIGRPTVECLQLGNLRFRESWRSGSLTLPITKPDPDSQAPFCAVLGCADSRVPPELIFAQELGKIFDVRVAGNVVDASTMASLLYAVSALKVRTVVVLGHQNCGAVSAAIKPKPDYTIVIPLLNLITPYVDPTKDIATAVKANVMGQVKVLKDNFVFQGIEDMEVRGACFSLDSGEVSWDCL